MNIKLPARSAVAPRRLVSMRVVIASLVIACMSLMAALLIGLGWLATSQRLVADAGQRAALQTTLLQEHLKGQLKPAQTVLRQLGAGLLPSTTGEAARVQRSAPLLDELRADPLLAAIYVAYPNGDFVLARPLRVPAVRARVQAPAEADFLVQTVTTQPEGEHIGSYHFLGSDGGLVTSRVDESYAFDARSRPWFQEATQHPGQPQSSEPYRFFTTRRVGVTLSRLASPSNAVVGIDLAFDDLQRLMQERRATPGTRLALLHADGQVLAATASLDNGSRERQPSLEEASEPELLRLRDAKAPDGQAISLDIDGRRWIGLRTRFDIGLGSDLELLQMLPLDELAAAARQHALRIIGAAVLVTLLLLPLGWVAGGAIGRSLHRLRERSVRIGRFDFEGGKNAASSPVLELSELSQAMQRMGDTIEAFLNLSASMATEPEVDRMLQLVLEQLTQATQSDAAAVFLWDAKSASMQKRAEAGNLSGTQRDHFDFPAERNPREGLRPQGPQVRHLDLELRRRDGVRTGLLVLEFAGDKAHADPAFLRFAKRLSGMLAVAIETRQLIESQRQLFDAIIQLMADAIDAKSPYTGGHCDRVPQLAIELVDLLHGENEGPYADFSLSDTERYAYRLGAWLHDCGKVTSPEHIVDKATKLEVIRNRIHEVRLRFEILWRDAEIAAARGQLDAAGLAARQQQLQDDFAFVAQCNLGSEFMADEAIARLRSIGAQSWQRHFDDRLGLSPAELRQLDSTRGEPPSLPATEALLADLPEHCVPWGDDHPPVSAGDPRNHYGFDMKLPPYQQNQGELHNLSIRRGTLTDEDRFKINDHIVQTYIMLKGLPWPAGLEKVPELAATHHERLDGKGYPRRLSAEQLSPLDRALALADVFEALTAADRPYKPPKTLSETLRIMAFMCKEGHLDPELFRYFLRSRLWERFAERFMRPEQRDAVDLDGLERIIEPLVA
ncbi:HD domain-containing phosphohydrolase [Paucibacter sp. R3-3]|uniref:HD domain-containing phosphohydrolase n=1 Tax=Roseateles agri TaxID=3098619 RepID=A0ABU5DED3_9BURK|nr:HD domain-containing phosphohydrolase [Paucibacter sp. R3-3]MDY0744638.1 HD domain-containing phosphohydrolase [Paucibacter sp. R3-3]